MIADDIKNMKNIWWYQMIWKKIWKTSNDITISDDINIYNDMMISDNIIKIWKISPDMTISNDIKGYEKDMMI